MQSQVSRKLKSSGSVEFRELLGCVLTGCAVNREKSLWIAGRNPVSKTLLGIVVTVFGHQLNNLDAGRTGFRYRWIVDGTLGERNIVVFVQHRDVHLDTTVERNDGLVLGAERKPVVGLRLQVECAGSSYGTWEIDDRFMNGRF